MAENNFTLLKSVMAKKYMAIMGYRVPIRDSSSAPAYTTTEPAIYIKEESAFTKGLAKNEKNTVLMALFLREMLKTAYSDYDYLANKIEEVSEKGFDLRSSVMPIFNAVENSVVINNAGDLIGGQLLKMVKLLPQREYFATPDISVVPNPFFQYLTAVIQYSDVGLLKGDFTDPQAKDIFKKSCPIILDAMKQIDPDARIDKYMELHKLAKPLWEPIIRQLDGYMADPAGMPEELAALASLIASASVGMGEEFSGEAEEGEIDRRYGKNRVHTWKEFDSSEAPEKADNSETIKAKNGALDRSEFTYTSEDIDFSSEDEKEETWDTDMADSCNFVESLIKSELEISEKGMEKPSKAEPCPDLPKIGAKYKKKNYACKNDVIKLSNPLSAINEYRCIVDKYSKGIKGMTRRLKDLFAEDAEEREYRESGKISMKKLMSSSVSSKMMTKKVDPSGRNSVAVAMAIDESGSMSGTRIDRAKASAIALSEVFAQLDLPLYVMGFTADTKGADVYHRHYLQWKGNKADHAALTTIDAQANNFDGYSIRYASEILGKRKEDHKILIVISDGQPACSAYSYRSDISGVADTENAIREARDAGQNVVGVAIGSDKSMLHKMYGDDFVSIDNVDDLFVGISKKITDMVKGW